MTQLNRDRTVTWKTKFPPRVINGHRYKKGHAGLLPGKTYVDFHEKMWHERGYKTRTELVFLDGNRAMWIVWRREVKTGKKK